MWIRILKKQMMACRGIAIGVAMGCVSITSCTNESVSGSPPAEMEADSLRNIEAEPARAEDKGKVSARLLKLPRYVPTGTSELQLELEIIPAKGVTVVAPNHVGEALSALQIEFLEKGDLDIQMGPYPDSERKTFSLYQNPVSVYDKPVRIPLRITIPDSNAANATNYYRVYGVVHFQTVSDSAPPSISALKLRFSFGVR